MKRLKVLLASAMAFCAALSIYVGFDSALTVNADAAVVQAAAPAPPSLVKEIYNTAVSFTWTVGTGGDSIQFSRNNMNWETIDSSVYTLHQFPNVWDHDNRCEPGEHLYRSYNSSTGLYSGTISLEHTVEVGEGHGMVLYGELCRYSVVDGLDISEIPRDELSSMPTSFDQTHYIWNHHASNRDVIKATIAYQGKISDIEVEIPWIGWHSAEVTLNGVTFSLRTGPNRCSIKVNQTGIRVTDVQFMFGIE